jgi:hypothetical protein
MMNRFFAHRRMGIGRRGTVALMVAISFTFLLGIASLSADYGYIMWVRSTLQAATNGAALAGAKDIGFGGTPVATAIKYGAMTTSLNNLPGITVVMTSGYPALQCFKVGPACSVNQTPPIAANGIQVQQKATVPLFFATIFGFPTMDITTSAAALAAGAAPPPLNVMFIVDATASMASSDSICGTTRIGCAVQGFETLLAELWPCASNLASCGAVTNHNVANPVDKAALLQFPGVQSIPTGGSCRDLPTVAYAGVNGKTNNTTVSPSTTLHFTNTPAFNNGSAEALVTDMTHPSYIQAGTWLSSLGGTTAVMSKSPTTGDTITSNDAIAVWPPVYQLVPLSSDYRTSDTATSLNLNSDLVACLESLSAPGGFGTFYADAIKIAQQNLVANARDGARNVIILLSDGEANATVTHMVAQGANPTAPDQCKHAVGEAQAAAAAGTWVYMVSYGTSAGGGCTTDIGNYANACWVMGQIANVPGTAAGTYVNEPAHFYADAANGCQSSVNPSITAIKAMFQNIVYSLTRPRMLPPACVVATPPSWC